MQKAFCPDRPSKTYLFIWPNGFIASLFGFGVFIIHYYTLDWYDYTKDKRRWWDFKVLLPWGHKAYRDKNHDYLKQKNGEQNEH